MNVRAGRYVQFSNLQVDAFYLSSKEKTDSLSCRCKTRDFYLHLLLKEIKNMSDAELRLVKAAENCTIYSIQFLSEDESEFERFYAKFRNESVYNEDFERLLNIIGRIADLGAFERFFRPEGKMGDRVCALPVLKSRLRLYCLRLSDKILNTG